MRGRITFRVGRIVYLAFSRDETLMGFGFPKEWREAHRVGARRLHLPGRPTSVQLGGRPLAAIDEAEMRDLVLDAWRWSCR